MKIDLILIHLNKGIDLYSSGLDWKLDNAEPHLGLLFFFAVSYMNGLVLEFGRKIRTPEKEEELIKLENL